MRNSPNGRLNVWDLPSDPYDHQQLATNFDRIDHMIGGPGGSPGAHDSSNPPQPKGVASSWLSLGDVSNDPENRTLYSVVSGLNFNDVPLGSIIMWWRPQNGVALPNGWVPCDGSTYVNDFTVSPPVTLHSYASETLTVPDMRNSFALGAYESDKKTYTNNVTITDLNRDGTAGLASDAPADGPGIGYTSRDINGNAKSIGVGSSSVRNLSHQHDTGTYAMPDHVHKFPHTHSLLSHTHEIQNHIHLIPDHDHYFYHTHLVPAHSHSLAHTHEVAYPERNAYVAHTSTPDAVETGIVAGVDSVSFWTGYAPSPGQDPAHGFGAWRQFARASAANQWHTHGVFIGNTLAGNADPYTRMTSGGPSVGSTGVQGDYTSGSPSNTTTQGLFDYDNTNRTSIGMLWDHSTPVNSGPSSQSDTGGAKGHSPTDGPDATDTQTGSSLLNGASGFPFVPGGSPLPGDEPFIDLTAVDVRPNYVGVLFIIKIKVAENIV